jgi:ankyrin repeat protein
MPLHVASKNKQEEVAKLLISYGADVNAQDKTGKTPIFYATLNVDLKITKLLLNNKANVKDNPELLNVAVRRECREIVEVLLEHGVDVNSSDEWGRTALHFTALGEDGGFFGYRHHKVPDINVKEDIAKLLLSRGANVNAQTKNGITTLLVATEKGYAEVVEALLEYNADVNCTVKNDMTPLHIAAQKGHLHVVEVLLKFGGSIDSTDEYGRTALHIASRAGHEQIVVALLEYGSDINITSKDNRTPLDSAMAGIRSFYDEVNNIDSDDDYCCRGRGICVCESIAEILKRHMVKLKTANLYVSEKNLLFMSYHHWLDNPGWDLDWPSVSDFQKKCEEEIARMKSEKVSNANVSFYDILTKDISQLAMYAGNESVVQIFRSDDYKIKFPIYASMINSNFRKGERRKELLQQGNNIFHVLFNNFPRLPHDCTEKIFSYLSDEDLRILIDACKPISVSSPNTDDNVIITSNIPKMS